MSAQGKMSTPQKTETYPKWLIATIVSVSVLLMGAVAYSALQEILRAHLLSPDLLALPLLVGVALLAATLSTVTHELGHVLFGWLAGFRFIELRAAFIHIGYRRGKLRWDRPKDWHLGGHVRMRPSRLDHLDRRLVTLCCGGMAVHLLMAPWLVSLWLNAPRSSHYWSAAPYLFVAVFTLRCLISIGMSINPRPERHNTDAKMIATLLRRGKEQEEFIAGYALYVVAPGPEGAKDRPLLERAIAEFGDRASTGQLIYALDSALWQGWSDIEQDLVRRILAKDGASPKVRAQLAYVYMSQGRDLAKAQAYLPQREEMPEKELPYWFYASVLIASAEGRFEEAGMLATEALALSPKDGPPNPWFTRARQRAVWRATLRR